MKKWNKICFIFVCLSLLFTCSACSTETDIPENTAYFFNDPIAQEKMHEAFLEHENTAAEILFGNWIPNEYPNFSVQNAEGQTLILDGEKAQGTIPLLKIVGFGPVEASYAWRYKIPNSERYIITPDAKQELLYCSITNHSEFSDLDDPVSKIEWFSFAAKGSPLIDHSLTRTTFSGRDMEYGLSINSLKINSEPTPTSFEFLGENENFITIKFDHNTLLFQGAHSESKLRMYGVDENGNGVDTILGICPAGKWTRLSYNGTEWILTEEPPSLWPWVTLGVGLLLAATASFLLYRRRKVTLPALPEDPEYDTAEHPPEAP